MNFLEKKIIAYFHDPPWKVWALLHHALYAPSGGHEDDAKELLSKILGKKIDFPPEIRIADRLASSIDRWIVSMMNVSPRITFDKKLNIFKPSLWYPIQNTQVNRNTVQQYVNDLLKYLNMVNINYKYHLAYFLTPLLWYEHFPIHIPLADTRVPTHTVFDHATATAAMTNILKCYENEVAFEGYVVSIEIPSVQELISYSRKTRDLWASSWITSALMWKSVEPFVEKYGPDVVLRPELSLNHFYIAWLYNKINHNLVKNEIMSLARSYAMMNSPPLISMMSERVILILPKDAEGEIKRIEDRFNEAWEIIASEALRDKLQQVEKWSDQKCYIEKAIEKAMVKPIVTIVDVEDAYRQYVKSLNPEEIKKRIETYISAYNEKEKEEIYNNINELLSGVKLNCSGNVPILYSLFFEFLIDKLFKEEKKVKFSYGVPIHDVVEKFTSSNYDICTVCGVLPAVLYYHEDRDDMYIDSSSYDDRLCPYCAVKRAMKSNVVMNIISKLGLSFGGGKVSPFPSTSQLAMMDVIQSNENIDKPEVAEKMCRCYAGYKQICNELKEKYGISEDVIKQRGNLYYAIIKADGDSLGKGYWGGMLYEGDALKSYIDDILQSIGKSPDNKVYANIYLLLALRSVLGINRQGVILTPAYAYTLTRALTIQSVIDKEILEKNHAYPIYLGGDDVLALSPIRVGNKLIPVEIAIDSRESYWQYPIAGQKTQYDGFKVVGSKIVVDSLRAFGRSYAVFVAHYKDPLPLSLNKARYLLELKDKVKGKDVIFFSTGRGIGGAEYAIIKFNWDQFGYLKELLKDIYSDLEDKKLSNSFIYDVEDISEYSNRNKKVFCYLLLRVIDRNKLDSPRLLDMKEVVVKLSKQDACKPQQGQKDDICKGRNAFLEMVRAISYLR